MHARFDLIAFDADDTLWHNETIFHATHERFRELLRPYHPDAWIDERLDATEVKNLAHFGYGIKGFILSMIETAIELTEGRITGAEIQTIIDSGRAMRAAPLELLDGVRETVAWMAERCRIAVITKGDLFDQETKLARSGMGDRFGMVEVVSEKNVGTYAAILRKAGVEPVRFGMIGNSLKSDILPVLALGGTAIHIPYPLTWHYERTVEPIPPSDRFVTLSSIRDLPAWWESNGGVRTGI
jgi:putative hydrolase of the HAD superfamily